MAPGAKAAARLSSSSACRDGHQALFGFSALPYLGSLVELVKEAVRTGRAKCPPQAKRAVRVGSGACSSACAKEWWHCSCSPQPVFAACLLQSVSDMGGGLQPVQLPPPPA
eukprot:scaffold74999_cov19-Tisochrysis_lutea.AAC.1